MIALILGGARSVWDDLAAAKELLEGRRFSVVAANVAGISYAGRLGGWATLHPDLLAGWAAQRKGNADFQAFAPERDPGGYAVDIAPERWPGSSGLYATQVALMELNASAVILCGVPMDQAAGHFAALGAWASTSGYRRAFLAALPLIGGRVRSMSGWTADVYGRPTAQWISAMAIARPMSASRPQQTGDRPLHHVENVGETAQCFNARRPDGNLFKVHLGPRESGVFDVDPNQAQFKAGALNATPHEPKAEPKPALAGEPLAPASPEV